MPGWLPGPDGGFLIDDETGIAHPVTAFRNNTCVIVDHGEDISYCPNCAHQMEIERCKYACKNCGYRGVCGDPNS